MNVPILSARVLLTVVLFLVWILPGSLRADGPADNIASKVRPIPPVGILVPEETRASLKEGLDKLETEIVALRDLLQKKPDLLSLMPDVEVFHKAVRYALDYGEFFHTNELKGAAQLLRQGMERAEDLRAGRSPWIDATGLVVRGYRSKISNAPRYQEILRKPGTPMRCTSPAVTGMSSPMHPHGRAFTLAA